MTQPFKLDVETPKDRQVILVTRGRERRLSEILRREHLPLNTRCGERGLCDGCVVELVAGTLVHVGTGKEVTAVDHPMSVRGCEHRPASDAHIRIPPRSLLAHKPQAVSEFRVNVPRAHDPLWQVVEVPPDGSLPDRLASRAKRRRPIRFAEGVPTEVVGAACATMEYRDDHWRVSGVAGCRPSRGLGLAVDIGTTTVALVLADLSNGEIVGRAAEFNKQMHVGDDVATRIGLCATDSGMVQQLQDLVVAKTIVPLLSEALRQAKAELSDVKCLTVAGNATMLHLFAGVDPSPMGTYPFQPAFLGHRLETLPALGTATVHLLPSAAAYIGADLTAGVLASGLAYDDGPSLLVDVGTNGEIILKHGDKLYGCATAAGPAFEGAGLTAGIRAGDGAIEEISLSKSPLAVHAKVIGRAKPIGLCGSAYVDLLAEGRRVGLLNEQGRFDATLVAKGRLEIARDVAVTEVDIAHLLQSKAAIGAGIETLLERIGLKAPQIKRLYLAGGFGMHLNVANAIACGMLPGFKTEQVQVVGNTSLAGAYLALLDCGALDEIVRISKHIEVIELNLDPHFESRYIDNLLLP